MAQITFDDYIKSKSMEYADTCRHYANNICYMTMKEPGQCPCGDYEVQKSCNENDIPCTGLTKKYKGLSRCFGGGTGCYRWCYNKDVSVKDKPDKYEPSK